MFCVPVADLMVESNFLKFLYFSLGRHMHVYDFYSTLACLVERNPTLAMEHGFFEILVIQ